MLSLVRCVEIKVGKWGAQNALVPLRKNGMDEKELYLYLCLVFRHRELPSEQNKYKD
jgi:hypothetical protein